MLVLRANPGFFKFKLKDVIKLISLLYELSLIKVHMCHIPLCPAFLLSLSFPDRYKNPQWMFVSGQRDDLLCLKTLKEKQLSLCTKYSSYIKELVQTNSEICPS